MRRTVFLMFLTIVLSPVVLPQAQQQNDAAKEAQRARDQAFDNRVDRLRNTGKERYIRDRYKDTRIYQDNILPLYRDLKDDEVALLAPLASDEETYASYLNSKDMGLIRLIADDGCDLGSDIVVAKPHCEKYPMPGAGASYSFRNEMYRVKRLADISFTGELLETKGVWKHGILISLGDVSLDGLSVDSKALETLVGFSAEMDVTKAGVFAGHLERGINGGDVVYRDSHPAKVDTTYVVRSIAYRGERWESIKEVVYDELELDRRRDVIVAFRVIRLVPNESVTIIWKMLSEKKSPKLK